MILGTFVQGQPGNTLIDKLISHTTGPNYYNDRISTIGGYKFWANTTLVNANFPSVDNVGYACFSGCTALNCVSFSSSLSEIKAYTFCNCDNLSQISGISWGNIETIGSSAFVSCYKLQLSIENSNITTIYRSTFFKCSSMTYGSFPNATEIQQNAFTLCLLSEIYAPAVTTFAQEAFKQATSLRAIDFPAYSGALQNRNFESCYNASYVNIPMATSFPMNCFNSCSKLQSITFQNVYFLGSQAFQNCTSLSLAYFGWSSATANMSQNAFNKCYNLLSLYLLGPNVMTLVNVNAFNSTPISTYTTSTGGVQGSIYVPESLYASYIAATNWITYSNRFVSMTDQEILSITGSWVSSIEAVFSYPQSRAVQISDGISYLKNNCLSVTATYYDGTSSILSQNDYIVSPPTISAGYNSRNAVKNATGDFRFIATIDAELPEGYTRVGYLQTSGTQYIDTELLPEQDDQFVIQNATDGTRNGNNTAFFLSSTVSHGLRQSANYCEFFWGGTRKTLTYYQYNNGINAGDIPTGTYNVLTTYPNSVLTIETTAQTSGTLPTNSYYVFASNNDGSPRIGENAIRIWYVEIVSRLKLIPCIRNSDSVVGMYDLMGNICSLTNTPFFINAGTGEFTYGYNP